MIERFITTGAFFLIAGVIGGFFSYIGLDQANKWSSIISLFIALASFALSALLFRQSTVRGSSTAPAPEAASQSKYDITNYRPKYQFNGDKQTHNIKVINKISELSFKWPGRPRRRSAGASRRDLKRRMPFSRSRLRCQAGSVCKTPS